MHFRISGLPLAPFAPLFGLPEEALAAHGAVRRIADCKPGYPCRVSLRDADVGESLLLLNWEHQPLATPYRASHAVYVREGAQPVTPAIDEVPELLRLRLLSVRSFDALGFMLDADVVHGREVESGIGRLLDDPRAAYLHLHNAKPGCYAARVDRA